MSQAAASLTPNLCKETNNSCSAFTWSGGHSRSKRQSQPVAQWFLTNTVIAGVLTIQHYSQNKFIFSEGGDKFIIFILV